MRFKDVVNSFQDTGDQYYEIKRNLNECMLVHKYVEI